MADGSFHEYPAAANGLGQIPEGSTLEFYRRQRRVILRNCGTIDPMCLEEGLARGAYRGALRALTQMTPEAVIAEVRESGLRGRGGAGFPTGRKWETARRASGDTKYVICNADEGDPGAFMDRSVLEGDPHAVLEGMLIASYAIGAREGYLYVRSEYPLAVSTVTHAIREAEARGLLGDDIFGSGHSFRVTGAPRRRGLRVRRGDGADRIDRGPFGRAAAAPPLPCRERTLGKTHGHQQRQDLVERRADPFPRLRMVCGARDRAQPRHHGVRPRRRREEYRPRRDPAGAHAPRNGHGDRRRHTR